MENFGEIFFWSMVCFSAGVIFGLALKDSGRKKNIKKAAEDNS